MTTREWHHCEQYAGDAGAVDIVSDGRGWRMEESEYRFGQTFQHSVSLAIVFCPFCGVRLGWGPERLVGPDGQTYTVVHGWRAGTIEEKP